MKNKKKKMKKLIIGLALVIILFNAVSIVGVSIAYGNIFSRADYDEYNTKYCYKYDEVNTGK